VNYASMPQPLRLRRKRSLVNQPGQTISQLPGIILEFWRPTCACRLQLNVVYRWIEIPTAESEKFSLLSTRIGSGNLVTVHPRNL
jgi:hypothetical protein